MSRITKFLLALAILLLALFIYAYASSSLTATQVNRVVESAADRQSVFESLADSLKRGDISTQFAALPDGDPENYAFVTYTVQLEGFNLLPAQWAVLSLTPQEGDIVLIQGAPQEVPVFGGAQLSATLLTRADAADAPRDLWADYYVMGRPHIARVKEQSAA